ncbi:DUF3040 domain-containing protein [Modestobacter lapidis]|nr:hypothetical protein [Modestobacter lapidis]
MLSDHERRVLAELERQLAAETGPDGQRPDGQRPDGPRPDGPRRDRHGPGGRSGRDAGRVAGRAAVAVLGWTTLVLGWTSVGLLITGAVTAALALAAAAGLCWVLGRYRHALHDAGTAVPLSAGEVAGSGAVSTRPGGAWLARYLKRISEVA